jgi:serine/threonine protein kinase
MTNEEFLKRYKYNPATDKLGEGGFGKVFKAYDNIRDRWVAIKIAQVDAQFESIRLKKEVEMVKHLPAHPNIAYYEDCYTFASFDGEYDFGILQYYEHGNLSNLLKQGKLSLAQKQSVLLQILSGLDFLHSQGIIHRDMKPQNILIVRRGDSEYVPKITDFGISKQLDVNSSSVFGNSIAGVGTILYASPEQLGERTIRKNTDLWSFGMIAFQMLTGNFPFSSGKYAITSESGRQELFRQINNGQLPYMTNSIAEPWQKLIRVCLIPDFLKRVKNCAECFAILNGEISEPYELDTLIDMPTSPKPAPPKPSPTPPKPAPPKPSPTPPKPVPPKPSKPADGEKKKAAVIRVLLSIIGGIAVILAVLFITGMLSSSPSQEQLREFGEYKGAAITNYNNAVETGVEDFYKTALKYCNDALNIREDNELKDLKTKIEKEIKK